MLQIDADRIAAGISQAALAMAAGISCDTYQRRLRRPETVSSTLLIKLHGALRALVRNKAAPSPVIELTRWAYAGALERTARFYGVTPEQVAETSPQRGATADAHWRACSHARQAAIYLVNTGAGIGQAKIAALLGLTPAAVCLALKDVEDRRDDPAFNEMIFGAMRAMAGRDE
ncbi:transcriptional regulator with XRE-family HTH domain [Rhodoblastus acidophilus]|uniref:hypothetical protein n=1 Tax=Rhodoblastus acidophilus TaxID=1074 RepID=UPI002225AC5E|nr:hypothetical protein [Rhodoblastus acidophilus]MCW2317452.1 transcriptional regulator with XRE-family HTH domain [Rhodoblastus acidophilus]